jgi:hypothetical protein
MNNLQELIKTLKKQNETIQGAFGPCSFQNLSAAITQSNQKLFDISGINNLTNIARTFTKQTKPIIVPTIPLDGILKTRLSDMQFHNNNSALFGLSSALSEIAKKNKSVADKLSGFSSSQLYLSNNLSQIAKGLNLSHLNNFNSLDIAIQGISKSYLKSIALTHDWEYISIAQEVNETITNITDELIINTQQITLQDLNNLRQSIISELCGLLRKNSSEKSRQFIFELIAIIGFLLTFYGTSLSHFDKSNKEVIIETKKELEKLSKEFSIKIESELNKLNKTRSARKNVYLRYSNRKDSRIIGIVKVGQEVNVIEIRHKYLLISYIDRVTSEPKSGFVIKKYFDIEK